MERDVRAGEHGRAGFRNRERQLQPAVGRIERGRREGSLVVGREGSARFGNGPGAPVHHARLVDVARRGERRELLRRDPVGRVDHAVEDRAVVLPEAIAPAQVIDMQDVEELEVEITSRNQHARHPGGRRREAAIVAVVGSGMRC